jgi:hypothetical protein
MPGANGATDLQPRDGDTHADQLDALRHLLDTVEDGAATTEIAERVLAAAAAHTQPGITAFRDLLRIETRGSRYHRLLRTWVGKVAGAIRQSDFEAAGMWMRALTEAPIHSTELAERMQVAMAELTRPDLLEELVLRLAAAGDPPEARDLLSAWGRPLIDHLIHGMEIEDPPVNRRHLVEYLGMAGTGNISLLVDRLSDPRWFIVRNVAIAVGRTGRAEAIPALERISGHEDDRVRVEALRSLVSLDADHALDRILAGFSDQSPRVRQAATSLLRACPDPEVVPGIMGLIQTGSVNAADTRRLVEVIAERKGDAPLDALSELAAKRLAVGVARVAREAAREALVARGEYE